MLMNYVDFISGALCAAFAYAMFTSDTEQEDDEFEEDKMEDEEGSGRLFTMSCQGCRKLKKHKEIKHNLYQCTKCKKVVDLR